MSGAAGPNPPGGPRVAIVGAGVAGLTLASRLSALGVPVTVVEKSRGPGGRCATRQTPAGAFDHGPGEVQARGEAFKAVVAALPDAPALGLNAWARRLADVNPSPNGSPWERLDATQVAALEPVDPSPGAAASAAGPSSRPTWMLRLAPATAGEAAPPRRLGPFDAVVVAVPAEQARTLLQPSAPLLEALRSVSSEPCWTLMAAWTGELPPVHRLTDPGSSDGPLQVARPMNGSPAGRWVLQASADWSTANLDADPAAVAERLLAAFSARAGVRLARPAWTAVHRWRYSQVQAPASQPWGWDASLALGSVGDAWAGRDPQAQGIERAWTSAQAFADAWMLGGIDRP